MLFLFYNEKVRLLLDHTVYPKKSSKWFKKLCANQVLHGCEAGSKKDFKGFYLGSIRNQTLLR